MLVQMGSAAITAATHSAVSFAGITANDPTYCRVQFAAMQHDCDE